MVLNGILWGLGFRAITGLAPFVLGRLSPSAIVGRLTPLRLLQGAVVLLAYWPSHMGIRPFFSLSQMAITSFED